LFSRYRTRCIKLAIAIWFAGPCIAVAATYYVDQIAGSDDNIGTKPGAPWKNCPGMSGYSGAGKLAPGDQVYFNRAETWLVSGEQGIYLTGGVTYVGNSWGAGSGKACIRANSDLDAGVIRFRDDPVAETVFEGFNVDGNGKVATGVDINHRYWSLMNGATKRVKDCEVHHMWSDQEFGQYKYGIIVSNHGGAGGYAENVEIVNCVVHDTPRDAICLYPGDENGDCRIKNCAVRGCEAYRTGQDPNFGAGAGIIVKGYVQDAVIEFNYAHDTVGAIMFVNGNEQRHYGVGPTNIQIRYNIFAGNTKHGAIRIYDGRSGKDPKDLKIYGNVVYNSTARGGLYIGPDLGNTLRLLLFNNTFYNAPVIIANDRATMTALEFTNNIVYCDEGLALTDTNGRVTRHSNNFFFSHGRALVRSNGVDYGVGDLATAYESSALSSDPLFRNGADLPTGFTGKYGIDFAPNRDGLNLQKESPATSAGVALGSDFDMSINSVRRVGHRWDVGAYQNEW
jgi:hypothetical protein